MEIQKATTTTEDVPIASNEQINNDFYVIGLLKLAILFSCTFGIYMVYWFYRNWKLQKDATKESSWPIMRVLFFTHELFERIDKKLRLTEKKYGCPIRT